MKEHFKKKIGFGSYKYLRIPYHENYIMDSKCNIYHLFDDANWQEDYILDPIYITRKGDKYISKIDDNDEDVGKLYLNTWYGYNTFEYHYEDIHDPSSVKAIIPKEFIEICKDGFDEITWDNILYRKREINGLVYYISEYGAIYSTYLRRLIKYTSHMNMHIKVKLGTTESIFVHRLVYDTFVGIINPNNEIDHLISTARHHYTELDEVTSFINKQRYFESNGNLSSEDIHFICKCMEDNIDGHLIFDSPQISGKLSNYEIFSDLCTHIKSGKSWKHISSNYNVKNYNPKSHAPNGSVTPDQAKEIYLMIKSGVKCIDVAKKFKISPNTVYRIRDKKFFKYVLNDL